jgi:hypothetical protein
LNALLGVPAVVLNLTKELAIITHHSSRALHDHDDWRRSTWHQYKHTSLMWSSVMKPPYPNLYTKQTNHQHVIDTALKKPTDFQSGMSLGRI